MIDRPLETKTFWMIVQELPARFAALISKIIGVKGLIFAVASWLAWTGKIESWAWVVIALFFVVGREIFKYMKDIR
ncbi:MAG: hypothetical protein WC982_09605 [Advenella sp.]